MARLFPKLHYLKCIPPHFEHVFNHKKTFELRRLDRDYKVNDTLVLQEYYPISKLYTSRECSVLITHIFTDTAYGLDPDYCILSIKFLNSNC